jgi:3D (Asp-Asp-Asp) domain-containing protein
MYNVRLSIAAFLAFAALAAPLVNAASRSPKEVGLHKLTTTRDISRRTALVSKAKTRKKVTHSLTYTVTATVYEAVPGQTDNEPFVTADNSHIKRHYGTKKRWMALSRDLLKPWGGKFNYGDKVRVRGISPKLDGVYTVHDTMNRRHRHCMDILAHPSEKLDIYSKGVKIQKVAQR